MTMSVSLFRIRTGVAHVHLAESIYWWMSEHVPFWSVPFWQPTTIASHRRPDGCVKRWMSLGGICRSSRIGRTHIGGQGCHPGTVGIDPFLELSGLSLNLMWSILSDASYTCISFFAEHRRFRLNVSSYTSQCGATGIGSWHKNNLMSCNN